MEDGVAVDDAALAVESAQHITRRGVEDVGRCEEVVAWESGAVAEERVPEVDELGQDIGPVDPGDGHAVVDEFADVLAEAGAEVEDDGVGRVGRRGGGEEGEDVGAVDGLFGQGEDREAIEAEAGVGVRFVGRFAEGLHVGGLGFAKGNVGVGGEELGEV